MNSPSFITIGAIISACAELYTIMNLSTFRRINNRSDMIKTMSGKQALEIVIPGCLFSLFYLIYAIYLLWTQFWMIGIILIFMGSIAKKLFKTDKAVWAYILFDGIPSLAMLGYIIYSTWR